MSTPDLLLLHGALGARDQLAPLAERLAGRYRVHSLDFEGHGTGADRDRPYRIEHFAENVADYMDRRGLAGTDVFGFSMGGYVALYLARAAPDRLGRILTLGTKLRWRPDEAAREVQLLDPERIQAKVPRYAAELAARHGDPRWAEVLRRMAEMMIWMGAHAPLSDADYQAIPHLVRLMVGDRDTTAGIEDTVAVHRLLPNSQLAVLPATAHPIDRVAPALLAELITGFFDGLNGQSALGARRPTGAE